MRPVLVALLLSLACAAPVWADSTLEQTLLGGDRAGGFQLVALGPGEPFSVRDDFLLPHPKRAGRRVSLAYFGQISDFQLADEESPARVEFLDGDPSRTASAAWRPQEALAPFVIDYAIRQLNAAVTSPVAQGDGSRARMVNAVLTGDLADSKQRNETAWTMRLLEGGTLDPNSGSADLAGSVCPPGTPLDDPRNYTGVQDYNDAGKSPGFYDPDEPFGNFAGWPAYPGLLDRAQQPFETTGLDVPSYVAFGNHDGLVQGNQSASAPIEEVATGCVKPLAAGDPTSPSLEVLLAGPTSMLVPPDPERQFVDKLQYKTIFQSGSQPDGHGFGLVDPAELDASAGAASYYAWSPTPGLRFVVLDTISEGGVTGVSSEGNLDDPQFRWLEAQLEVATARDELVVVFSHHAIGSLNADLEDEAAGSCDSEDQHGHGENPGCDQDPRNSTPIHLGGDVRDLFLAYPHVIAFVSGHSHNNRIAPYKPPEGEPGGFWEIKSPATADWPSQDRVIDVMENCDQTLSIFSAMLDNPAPLDAPAPGSAAGAFDAGQLASVARLLTYNDPQVDVDAAAGETTDRNVELLLHDPRSARPPDPKLRLRVKPRRVKRGRRKRVRLVVRSGGRPVPGAVVRLGRKKGRTNAKGVARLRVKLKRRTRAIAVKRLGCTKRRAGARVRITKRRH